MAGIEGQLRALGGRSTLQRRAIFGALSARHDHPTAESLHREIRRRIPGLSLATVYRTLDLLVRAGMAIRLPDATGVARYDARTDGHDHLRCLGCGRVEDLQVPHLKESIVDLNPASFTVTDYRLELVGYCAGCGSPRPGNGEHA